MGEKIKTADIKNMSAVFEPFFQAYFMRLIANAS